jgi:nucleotide exchange factor SIL1
MFKKSSVFILFLFIILIQCNENEDNDVFVPTKEWQTVKKGQKIPKGLHVRINLETGLTEAKLLDDDQSPEDKTKALTAVPQDSQDEKLSEKIIPKSILEEAVKNIKGDDLFTPDEIKNIQEKFRSYDDIKKSLGELNLTPKIDAEVIADLLKKHKEVTTGGKVDKAEVLKILEDLDFLAHQYDNAREFVRQNGFQEIIYKNLNRSNTEIKKETLKLMGSLMQNNVGPKIHALETGGVGILLRLINFGSDSGIKSRALTALGALLRSFPVAQQKFVESGGLTVLSKFFDTDNIKIQIRIVTMISDLIVEHKWAAFDEKLSKYYTSFNLTKYILEHDWCKKLNRLLLGLLITDKDDHDSLEKCLTAMHSLREHCGRKYEKDLLESLKKRYQLLSSNESDDNTGDSSDTTFFSNLKDLCDEILLYVNQSSVKTEL